MAFERLQFMGLSVQDVQASTGWNEQQSTLSLQLVQDHANGDWPQPVTVGHPIYFQLGSFRFFGLLQRFVRKNDQRGFPTFEAICVDPRELIRNVTLIVNAYNGSIFGVPNLINVYGYFESLYGFGASFATEAGMPWGRVLAGLNALITSPLTTSYGGPIRYKGVTYSLDLTSLPVPPAHYRIGGGGVEVNLLDVITQLCQDYGLDYFVDLVGFTIRVRTVNRSVQPPLGTITNLVNTNTGNVLRNEAGLEDTPGAVRSVFLIGGPRETILAEGDPLSFWGYDINAQPIVGTPGAFRAWIKKDRPVVKPVINDGAEDFPVEEVGNEEPEDDSGYLKRYYATEWMTLNASPVADILGATFYFTNLFELRCALTSIEMWMVYMVRYRQGLATILFGANDVNLIQDLLQNAPALNVDMEVFQDRVQALRMASDAGAQTEFSLRRQRMHQFVQGYAQEYYGRSFLFPLPFAVSKVDGDAAQIGGALLDAYSAYVTYSQQPTDRAYYALAPLSLPELYRDLFADVQNRWEPFVFFAGDTHDLSGLSPGDHVVANGGVYLKAQIAREMIFLGGMPYALITLPQPVWDKPQTAALDLTAVAYLNHGEPEEAQRAMRHYHGPLYLHPGAVYPALAAIPMRSNVSTYGPWVRAGHQGRVQVLSDEGLVPWNHGGEAYLDLAAQARIDGALSTQSEIETGTLDLAGTPLCSLGEALATGGPQVTGLSISYSTQGVVTSYRFQTYTPRFGSLSRIAADRAREVRQKTLDLGRVLRQTAREQITTSATLVSATRGSIANKILVWEGKRREKQEKKETPHDVIYYTSIEDLETGRTLPQAESVDLREGIAQAAYESEAEPEHYARTAMMSWTGLVRGLVLDTEQSPAGQFLPAMGPPASGYAGELSSRTLDPWGSGSDVMGYLWGDSYGGFNAYRLGTSGVKKVVGLRGPLVVAGWGYDTDTNPVPGVSGQFVEDHRARSELWKAGPVDLLWDERRQVWTPHDLLRGQALEEIGPSGGLVQVLAGSGSDWTMTAYSHVGAVPSGAACHLGFHAWDHRWYALGGGVSGGSPPFVPTGFTGEFDVLTRAYCQSGNLVFDGRTLIYDSGLLISAVPVESVTVLENCVCCASGACVPSGCNVDGLPSGLAYTLTDLGEGCECMVPSGLLIWEEPSPGVSGIWGYTNNSDCDGYYFWLRCPKLLEDPDPEACESTSQWELAHAGVGTFPIPFDGPHVLESVSYDPFELVWHVSGVACPTFRMTITLPPG